MGTSTRSAPSLVSVSFRRALAAVPVWSAAAVSVWRAASMKILWSRAAASVQLVTTPSRTTFARSTSASLEVLRCLLRLHVGPAAEEADRPGSVGLGQEFLK